MDTTLDESDPKDTNAITDNYDTIDWLIKNVANHNGRVGQWGVSADGWETVMGMINAHPALKASSPQASPADMFIGDDWHHNGAFRIMYTFNWMSMAGRAREGPTEQMPTPFGFDEPWGYRFFMRAGPAIDMNERLLEGKVPTWDDFTKHGNYDDYWQDQNVLRYLKGITHPVLNVAGWFDAEDFYGPMSIYSTIEKASPENKSTLVVGPWRHGGWGLPDGDSLGDQEFGSMTSLYFQRVLQRPFFRYHLKDEGEWNAAEAVVFETGTNEWRSFDTWPPEGTVPRNLYLQAGGKLSFEATTDSSAEAYDSYVSDPEKPVPFTAEMINRLGHTWMIEDQRFTATRPDVLVYESDVLTEDLTIAGPILADLQVSTSGTDSDWIVKLIDVFPNGRSEGGSKPRASRNRGAQMLLSGEIMRGKFRNSLSDPEPMAPGEITPVKINLPERFHTFKKGHRLMVQIHSTWFPAYDRNPQQFMDIYSAKPSDYKKATQKVYRSAKASTHLVLPIFAPEAHSTS